jgi:hypothetical protein
VELRGRAAWAHDLVSDLEGEFSNVARSYAGKRVVRHVW